MVEPGFKLSKSGFRIWAVNHCSNNFSPSVLLFRMPHKRREWERERPGTPFSRQLPGRQSHFSGAGGHIAGSVSLPFPCIRGLCVCRFLCLWSCVVILAKTQTIGNIFTQECGDKYLWFFSPGGTGPGSHPVPLQEPYTLPSPALPSLWGTLATRCTRAWGTGRPE